MLLEISNLKVKINGKEIIKGLDLKIRKGEIYCLIGKNGTGKSTLSQTIVGVHKYKGEIRLNGEEISSLTIDKRVKRGISIAWQRPISIEGLTVKEFILLSNRKIGENEVKKALSFVGLDYDEYKDRMLTEELSGGERKLIELASIIVMDSKLIILDEPDSGIDVIGISLVKKIIKRLKEEGKSILLITHREDMVKVADRAGIMCDGKIRKEGSPDEIYNYLKSMCKRCNR